MKPISPIIPGLEEFEIKIAENQDDYETLPALRVDNQRLISRWKLTWRERLTVLFNGSLYLHVWTFNQPHILRSRYAIFEKNGVFGVVALAITPIQNVVSRHDPRIPQQPNTYKGFATPAEAEHWFEESTIATATVSDNGWKIVYNGPRNSG